VLTLRVAAPGDFSTYRLAVPSPVLDPFFDGVPFTFKAGCPSNLDCEAQPAPCPAAQADTPPINYLAKDFLSFRQALLDFSALRYPDWQERSEADFGVMFAEALSSVADDLSYQQDRAGAEAALVTATQRRSAVRHARLVDYEPSPATLASVMLQFDVGAGVTSIAYGLGVTATGADGGQVLFETGEGLRDRLIDPLTGDLRAAPPSAPASPIWNTGVIKPYWFDDSQRCLPAGSTSMYVLGRGYDFQPEQRLLIETAAENTADPPVRQIVQLLARGDPAGRWSTRASDPLFPRPPDPPGSSAPFMTVPTSPPTAEEATAVTRIAWRAADALTADRDLTRTTLAGNIVPATQGATVMAEPFVVTPGPAGGQTPTTIVRTGPRQTNPDGTPGGQTRAQLYTLAQAPLAWLAAGPNGEPAPEIVLGQATDAGGTVIWDWFRWLLDAGQFDSAFTIDAAKFVPIARNSDSSIQADYASDDGDTLRFGDATFGLVPDDGAVFTATYRVGAGAAGNVAAGAVSQLSTAAIAAGLAAVTNPLPATGGADPEPLARIVRNAPQAFRAKTFRAVIPHDYEAAAETLPWVQRAGCRFRWTGSWLTVFTTPDPLDSEAVTTPERVELIDLLNRYRLAGYESYAPDPQYASIDLQIEVCARPDAFAADVKAMIVGALSAARGGFFAPDNFSFGQPLERSTLEAAIQRVTGVAGVLCVHYRLRDRMGGFAEMPDEVAVGASQIIRCDNDPSLGEHGSFSVTVEGGR
jgi:predicted phage baseplate assembly protein